MGEIVSAEVLAAISEGVLILTDRERTARLVRQSWDELQAERKLISWEPANVFSWRAWTHLIWNKLLVEGRVGNLLLTRVQEQQVWITIVASGAGAGSPRTIDSLAGLVADAWQRLCAYGGPPYLKRSAQYLQGDSRQFARWASTFEEICRRESLLSGALLEAELVKHLTFKDLARVDHGFLLLGFDRVTPAQNTLLNTIRSLGGKVIFAKDSEPHEGLLVTAADEEEELRGCALWIREILRETPTARIAIIVNDLDREMETIDSVLRENLSSAFEEIESERDQLLYEFSLGRTLAHEPMVQAAQDLLLWAVAPITLRSISRLLLSPYFAFERIEVSARAEFDIKELRRQLRLRPEGTIADVLQDLRRNSRLLARLPKLYRALTAMEHAQAQADLQARSFGEWSEWIRAWLARCQWTAAEESVSSREYQLRDRWETALDDLATLDFSGGKVSVSDALAVLDRLVQQTIFAPEARNSPVQILGSLEAAGERFDAIWILRAGEMTWPPRASAIPFLPRSLQQELEMPGADIERERRVSQRLTRRLAGCATNVVFSYAQLLSSQGHQRVSSVVRDLQLREATLSEIISGDEPRVQVELERSADVRALPPLPKLLQRGGARIFELQAACGFRAFAELRLGSVDTPERNVGLDAMERGSVVHAALEHFWSSVKSQRELRAMRQTAREDLIQEAVTRGLERVRNRQVDRWDDAYLRVQELRLARLLAEWIDMELERPDFTVVAQEEHQHISIGPLQLALRVDRVDLVENQQVIIDYKTGSVHPSQWLGDRPDKPQVPLYALLASEASTQGIGSPPPLGAVGVEQVRAGKDMKLQGFEAAPGILTTSASGSGRIAMEADSFVAQVERWRAVLEKLANDFAEGDARVRPKRYPTTCERCGQRLLCRLDASTLEQTLDDDPDSDQDGDDDA